MAGAQLLILCISLNLWVSEAYNSGDVLSSTDGSSVDKALADLIAHSSSNSRACAVGYANLGPNKLSSPQHYLSSGKVENAAPAEISEGQSGLTLFQKKDYSTFGSEGIFSYDIEDTLHKVVVYWSVPWNTVFYGAEFNIKIYRKELETDKSMYSQMKTYSGHIYAADGWLEKSEYGIKIKARLSNESQAKLYISVDTSGYNKRLPAELHTECDYNMSWFGSYCWQECSPTGYCWADQKCKTSADCTGPLQCYDPCVKTR